MIIFVLGFIMIMFVPRLKMPNFLVVGSFLDPVEKMIFWFSN